MSMPNELIFVRHGQSEPNVIHDSERNKLPHDALQTVYERHDWQQRLSQLGVDQAQSAGVWLQSHGYTHDVFSRCYASPFLRARETACYVGGPDAQWHLDDRIKERDWGEFGSTPKEFREQMFPFSHRAYKTNKWYARLNGGESLADNVLMRARDFVGTLHRELAGSKVLVVCHGEFMLTMRYLLERMLPEEWLAMDEDAAQDMKNCTILHYTRVNPDDRGDVRPHISWVRMIYPYDETASPWGGKWQKIDEKRVVSAPQLLRQIEIAPPLIRRHKDV